MATVQKKARGSYVIKDENHIPAMLSVTILNRALGEDGFTDLFRQYNEAKKRAGAYYQPSERDLGLWHQWIAGEIDLTQAAKEMACTTATVNNRFGAISRLVVKDNLKMLSGKWKR